MWSSPCLKSCRTAMEFSDARRRGLRQDGLRRSVPGATLTRSSSEVGTGAGAPGRSFFSTSRLSRVERLAAWQQHIGESLLGGTCRSFSEEGLLGEHVNLQVDEHSVHAVTVNGHLVDRMDESAAGRERSALFITSVIRGGFTYYSTGAMHLARPGDTLTFDPSQGFIMVCQPETQLTIVEVSPRWLDEILAIGESGLGDVRRTRIQCTAGSNAQVQSLYDAVCASTPNMEVVACSVRSIIDWWLSSVDPSGGAQRYRKAMRYIRSQATEDSIRAEDVAAHLGVSTRQLNRVFRSRGSRIAQAILEVRLDSAKSLLTESSTPIGRIAVDCGFGSSSNFSRVFAANTGTTPTMWRRGGSQHE